MFREQANLNCFSNLICKTVRRVSTVVCKCSARICVLRNHQHICIGCCANEVRLLLRMLLTTAFQHEGMRNMDPSSHNHDLMSFDHWILHYWGVLRCKWLTPTLICFKIQYEMNFQLPFKCGLFLCALQTSQKIHLDMPKKLILAGSLNMV